MEKGEMTITYQGKQAVYVNLTNRCPCACTFCIRNGGPGVFGSGPLWLPREPTQEEVEASLDSWDYTRFREVVFCGYGEPTERLDALLHAAAHVKRFDPSVRVRVNTNGLSDLINGKPTAHLFAGLADCISVSLNTDDPGEYLAICRPKFGAAAYPAMLAFAKAAVEAVPEVVMTVVGEPVTDEAKQGRCRAIAESLGARLRVRPYEGAR
jgi:TatD family-associated radical SAM protein